jgi:DNA-directed RNA polymerase specialized sigma24 family protein
VRSRENRRQASIAERFANEGVFFVQNPPPFHSPPPSLLAIAANQPDRNAAIVAASTTAAYSYREIAEHFGVHLATVGRIVRAAMLQGEN